MLPDGRSIGAEILWFNQQYLNADASPLLKNRATAVDHLTGKKLWISQIHQLF